MFAKFLLRNQKETSWNPVMKALKDKNYRMDSFSQDILHYVFDHPTGCVQVDTENKVASLGIFGYTKGECFLNLNEFLSIL